MAGFFVKVVHISLLLLSSCHLAHTQSEEEEGGKGKNVVITDKNWEQVLRGEWLLKFYAPWCPACRAMEDTWEKFAVWAAENHPTQVKVGSIDVTTQVALNGRFMITKLPTIYHVIDGEFRLYTTNRELEDFTTYVGNEEWKEVSPVSSWTSPTSFIMSSMSKLFTLSMELKSYHTHLSTEHGFPQWLSMVLFGLVIILVGLLLGVVFVLVSDYLWGPPQYYDDNVVSTDADADAGAKDAGVVENKAANGIISESSQEGTEKDGSESDESKPLVESEESSLRQRKVKVDNVQE